MKRQWILLLWLLGILAPMAWLARFIPGYDQLFNFIFGPAWMHWVSHALLFAVLSFLLLTLLVPKGRIRWSRVALAFLFVLAVAWTQERIQLWYKARAWGGDEWFDLGVDFAGALVGVLAWGVWRAVSRARRPEDEGLAATDARSARPGDSERPANRPRHR
jgi:hypothetical protein